MAFKIWPWNSWLDEAETNGELLLAGLRKAVSTHRRIRGKSLHRILDEYGVEREDIVNALGIKILSDHKIEGRKDSEIGDKEIGQQINCILGNLLTDLYRKRRRERDRFVNVAFTSGGNNTDRETAGLEDFLPRRLYDLSLSPEGLCILEDLLRVSGSLTPRQQVIFKESERFDQGEMTVQELAESLKYSDTLIYEEIRQISIKLINAFGFVSMRTRTRRAK